MPDLGTFGPYHPQTVHFVIALSILGVVLRWISLTGRVAFAGPAAATLILLAAVASVVAAQAGIDAHGPGGGASRRAGRGRRARGMGNPDAQRAARCRGPGAAGPRPSRRRGKAALRPSRFGGGRPGRALLPVRGGRARRRGRVRLRGRGRSPAQGSRRRGPAAAGRPVSPGPAGPEGRPRGRRRRPSSTWPRGASPTTSRSSSCGPSRVLLDRKDPAGRHRRAGRDHGARGCRRGMRVRHAIISAARWSRADRRMRRGRRCRSCRRSSPTTRG